jgi:hypothetical protein
MHSPPYAARVSALAVALVFLLAPAAHASRQVIYGVNDGGFAANWATMAPRLEQLGTGTQVGAWVRWPCGTTTHDWLTDGTTADLGAIPASQPVLVQVLGDPGCSPSTRRQRRAFAGFARGLVRRYPQIRELQVWNEPDLAFWHGSMLDYARLLAATHDALRGTGVKVIGPGFSPHVTQGEGVIEGFAAAVRVLYLQSHRHGSILDGFAYHPYWGYGYAATVGVVKTLNTYWRGIGQRTPRHGLRLWWTETGSESTVNDAPRDEFGGDGYYGVSNGWPSEVNMMGDAASQASKVAEVARVARASKWVAADFNFQLGDDGNLGRWQSGLYYVDGTPKPAAASFREAIRR